MTHFLVGLIAGAALTACVWGIWWNTFVEVVEDEE